MKLTFKFLFYTLFIASLFTFTSCEDNLETSCDDFSATISYEIDTSTNILAVNLTANPIGGVAPFTYAWSTGENSQTISVTEEAVYSVTLTDADACTASLDFTVQDTTSMGCSGFLVAISAVVMEDESILTATAEFGTAPYSYLWSNDEITESIVVVESGLYSVTATDTDGCTAVAYIQHYPDTTNGCNLIVAIDGVDNGIGETTLTATPAFGTAPYSFYWNNGAIGNIISVLDPGLYTVTVEDIDSCIATASYQVFADSTGCDNFYGQITVDYNPNGADVLTAEVNGGTTPYAYSWNTGEITESIQPNATGTYLVDVVDADGCSLTMTVEYAPVNCNDFEIEIVAVDDSSSVFMILYAETINGSSNLTDFLWSTGASTSTISVPPQGTFSVTITNDEGCIDEDEITL